MALFQQGAQAAEDGAVDPQREGVVHLKAVLIGELPDVEGLEEGIEPELENMLQSDKKLFMKKKVPVFYSPKDVNRCIVYLEDSQ